MSNDDLIGRRSELDHRNFFFERGIAVVLSSTLASGAWAQDWPTRPIKIVTPLAAGGAADILGHSIGDAFSATTKLPVIIDNRPGDGGFLAAVTVAQGEPDGSTLLLGTAAALNVAPVLAKNFPSDLVASLTPLTLAVELPMCLVVNKSSPVSNITELIAYAKAHPGKLAFGSSGSNTVHHIAGEFLKRYAGIDWVHVPYPGGSPAMTDLLAGQIPVPVRNSRPPCRLSTAAPSRSSVWLGQALAQPAQHSDHRRNSAGLCDAAIQDRLSRSSENVAFLARA
jgi:tripartite-type tricarboxylate transporter receptor subunit TctC